MKHSYYFFPLDIGIPSILTPILKFYTAARGSRLYFCSEKSVSPFFLFLFPIPLCVLNPPARLGLFYPAFREDRFDFGH